MTSERFDLAIVGSGSAAFSAAIRASELGARVAMVERGTVGGTCVNVGCIPSKAELAAAAQHHRAAHITFPGISTSANSVNLAALVAGKDEIVRSLRQERYLDLVEHYGFELIEATARFADRDTLLADGEPLPAERYLLATGASPAVPPIEGLDEAGYLTSTTALERTELPRRLAVIGGKRRARVRAALRPPRRRGHRGRDARPDRPLRGAAAAENALTNGERTIDYSALPRITFTSPQVAAVGLTDEQAGEQGIDCSCRTLPLDYVPRALVERDTRGIVKIVIEGATRRIVGATVVAEGAGDVILAAVYAVQFGLTVDQIVETWAPYLTMSEAFKLAAQTFDRDVANLSCCA